MDPTEVVVESVEQVGQKTVAITFASPDGFDADPGQFVLVRATLDGEDLARHYTISSPTVEETTELTVGIDPDGDLSPWLAGLDPGDTIKIQGPYGEIYHEAGDAIALAGGPGIGAAVAVAERALDTGGSATVVYQPESDPAHRDRLLGIVERGGTVHVVAEDEAFQSAVAAVLDDAQVYVFGFRPFVEAARDAIEAGGGDPEAAAYEPFS